MPLATAQPQSWVLESNSGSWYPSHRTPRRVLRAGLQWMEWIRVSVLWAGGHRAQWELGWEKGTSPTKRITGPVLYLPGQEFTRSWLLCTLYQGLLSLPSQTSHCHGASLLSEWGCRAALLVDWPYHPSLPSKDLGRPGPQTYKGCW